MQQSRQGIEQIKKKSLLLKIAGHGAFSTVTVSYLIALSLLAMLAFGGFFVLRSVISSEEASSTLINISGRQRRLSQSIAFYSLKLSSPLSNAERADCRKALREASELMLRSHKALTNLTGEFGLPKTMSPKVQNIYFKEGLDSSVRRFLAMSSKLLASSADQVPKNDPALLYLTNVGPTKLVEQLDLVVHQYELDAQLQVRNIELMETNFLMATLLLLASEAAFIFFPMSKKVRDQVYELEDFFENAVVGLHWVGPDGVVLRANRAELDLLGYQSAEVVGQHVSKLHADEIVVKDIMSRLSRNEELRNFEAVLRCKNGALKTVLIDSNVYFEKGKFVRSRCFTRDITLLKDAERELRKRERSLKLSEERYDLAVAGSHDGIWDWDLINGTAFYSDQSHRQLGYEPGELDLSNMEVLDSLVHPDDLKRVKECAQLHLSDKTPYDIEYRVRTKGGDYKWIHSRGQAIWDASGRPFRFAGSHRDISERIKNQESLRESESRFRQMAENIQEVFWMTDISLSKPIFVSQAYEVIFGSTVNSLFDNPEQFFDATHSDDRETLLSAIGKQQSLDHSQQIEYRICRPDGAVRWVWARLCSMVDESGNVTGLCGVISDITERKEAEKELAKSENLFKAIFDHTFELIGLLSLDGTVLQVNKTTLDVVGIPVEELVGRPFWETRWFEHSIQMQSRMKEAISEAAAGKIVRFEASYVRNDGGLVNVDFSLKPVRDLAGNVIMLIPEGRDINEKKEAEKRVSEFYSTVSHELRTPLTSIRGALGLLEGGLVGEIAPAAMDLIKMGRTESDRLVRLINDILDIKKIEAGKLELNQERLHPAELVKRTVDAISALASEAKVTVVSEITENRSILADRDRLIQVLTNLVSNAIKYSPAEGTVSIKASHAQGELVKFAVKDEGCGIGEDNLHKLLVMFQQIDQSDNRSKGGTGLGLAICKAIIEQHGGQIGVDTAVGSGAEFWFELPLEPHETGGDDISVSAPKLCPISGETQRDEILTPMLRPRTTGPARVLLIEDDQATRNVLVQLLAPLAVEIIEASDGQIALIKAKESHPDLIVLDLGLPTIDGFAIVSALQEEKYQMLPLLVYTASDLDNAQKSALTLGPTIHLTKSRTSEQEFLRSVLSLLEGLVSC